MGLLDITVLQALDLNTNYTINIIIYPDISQYCDQPADPSLRTIKMEVK